jgi:hypothetical protein
MVKEIIRGTITWYYNVEMVADLSDVVVNLDSHRISFDCEYNGYAYNVVLNSKDDVAFKGTAKCKQYKSLISVNGALLENESSYVIIGEWLEENFVYKYKAEIDKD